VLKRFQQRRVPIYVTGFVIGAAAVFMVSQIKKAMAPNFEEMNDERPAAALAIGGQLRLQLGEEPGRSLIWGFPTQLMVAKDDGHGHLEPIVRMEYKDLVDKETLVGPMDAEGVYELRAQFFACDMPGQKYCARVNLVQPFTVKADPAAAKEIPLAVDVKAAASKAAGNGAALEAASTKK
jgi:hypothetical protein